MGCLRIREAEHCGVSLDLIKQNTLPGVREEREREGEGERGKERHERVKNIVWENIVWENDYLRVRLTEAKEWNPNRRMENSFVLTSHRLIGITESADTNPASTLRKREVSIHERITQNIERKKEEKHRKADRKRERKGEKRKEEEREEERERREKGKSHS